MGADKTVVQVGGTSATQDASLTSGQANTISDPNLTNAQPNDNNNITLDHVTPPPKPKSDLRGPGFWDILNLPLLFALTLFKANPKEAYRTLKNMPTTVKSGIAILSILAAPFIGPIFLASLSILTSIFVVRLAYKGITKIFPSMKYINIKRKIKKLFNKNLDLTYDNLNFQRNRSKHKVKDIVSEKNNILVKEMLKANDPDLSKETSRKFFHPSTWFKKSPLTNSEKLSRVEKIVEKMSPDEKQNMITKIQNSTTTKLSKFAEMRKARLDEIAKNRDEIKALQNQVDKIQKKIVNSNPNLAKDDPNRKVEKVSQNELMELEIKTKRIKDLTKECNDMEKNIKRKDKARIDNIPNEREKTLEEREKTYSDRMSHLNSSKNYSAEELEEIEWDRMSQDQQLEAASQIESLYAVDEYKHLDELEKNIDFDQALVENLQKEVTESMNKPIDQQNPSRTLELRKSFDNATSTLDSDIKAFEKARENRQGLDGKVDDAKEKVEERKRNLEKMKAKTEAKNTPTPSKGKDSASLGH